MLLTLAANSLKSRLVPKKTRGASADALSVTDLPRLTRETLGLYGLHLTTPMLAGADLTRLDAVRDAADKASCPCLTLTEIEPQLLCTENDKVGDGAVERIIRVVRAAHRLGCNAIGVSITGEDEGDALDFCIERVRAVLAVAERLEVNILIVPMAGLTADPERLTDLIKKIGGFRVGTFPDFETASKQPDPALYLRRIVPYAGAVTVSCRTFTTRGKGQGLGQAHGQGPSHEAYDLPSYLKVLEAVGYTGTLAIDYRGEGDPLEGLRSAKSFLESALGPPAAAQGPTDPLLRALAGLDDEDDEGEELEDKLEDKGEEDGDDE